MPPLNVLIKPASGLCNLHCTYCFYRDVTDHRSQGCYGIMSLDTLEVLVRRIFDYAEGECTIAWQGGEPTLAGLDFFRRYIELEEQYNTKHIPVHRAIQTNGYGLTDEWAAFFGHYHVLTGLSLDGVRSSHDRYRKTPSGEGSFSSVFAATKLLERYHVDYNILTVVHRGTAEKIRQIYPFYQEHSFRYQQYIACLDPLDEPPGQRPWSLTPELYGRFLIDLFQMWYQDARRGRAPYIRQFENYIGLLAGIQPESCEQRGVCGVQTVVEADGSVYPCDFYVTDAYRLGNLKEHSIAELRANPIQQAFVQRSIPLPEQCTKCPYLHLCRGGCSRCRLEDGLNYFCPGYQMFFQRCLPKMEQLANDLIGRKRVTH